MKKMVSLFAILISLESFAGSVSDSCHHFKTGKFSYTDSAGVVTSIERTKKQQTEVNIKTGLLTRSKIRWVGECTYELTQTWANRKEQRKYNGNKLIIRITGFHGNSYEYTCVCGEQGKSPAISGTVVKTGD